jgi:hypothetical protein
MQPGLPLRAGDALRRADVLDAHLAIAEPAERLLHGAYAAVERAEADDAGRRRWALELELRLLKHAAELRSSAVASGPPGSTAAEHARALALHASRSARAAPGEGVFGRETALKQQQMAARVVEMGERASMGAARARGGAMDIETHSPPRSADALEAARAAKREAARAAGAADAAADLRAEAGHGWADGLYAQRVNRVWHRADVRARFEPNFAALAQPAARGSVALTRGGGGPALYRDGLEAPGSTDGALRAADVGEVASGERPTRPDARGRASEARWQS